MSEEGFYPCIQGKNKLNSQRVFRFIICEQEENRLTENLDLVPRQIRISIGGVKLEVELKPTRTTQAIFAALPIETSVNTWGEEFYCKIPGVKDYRETATTQVKVGDVAYWGNGEMLAIFFWSHSHEPW